MKCVGLIVFCVGGGSKLLQSQLDGSKETLSIPGYPLKYFYKHWEEWKRKYKAIDKRLALKLITKHHSSIIDSRLIPGNNGLRNLGKNRDKFIHISKEIFSRNFLNYLKDKSINSKNVLLAIHSAYFLSKKQKIQKTKSFLFHIHEAEYFNRYAINDFKDMKLLVCCRDPINYFWKRIKLDNNIEKERFNYTDRVLLKQYDYLNSLDSIFCGFKDLRKNFFKKYHVIKFEDLKEKNFSTLKKVGKYLNIKISKKLIRPTFDGLEWWSDDKYDKFHKKTFDGKVYDYSKDFKNFFFYEMFILKYILRDFFKVVNYKSLLVESSILKTVLMFLLILLPTKNGIKTLFYYFNPLNIFNFARYNFIESFSKNKLLDYYFNAMYKHKNQYGKRFFLKYNFLRKFIFFNEKKENMIFVVSLFRILIFCLNFVLYFGSMVNIILLYFKRIICLINNFFRLNKIFV